MTPILSATLLRTQSDARLAALATDGHERAFEAIVERYRRPLHRYCRRLLPESRAEDVVQQTFLKAWTALQGGSTIADLRPWLYRIAHNATLDAVRKAGYDYDELTEALQLAPGADADLERRAVMRETLAGVAALPESQREALLRTAIEGHSRADIARDLGVSEGAVRQLVHRARSTLRAAATAITPLPFAGWAAAATREMDPVTQRIAEVAATAGTAGTAGATGVLLKTGTVLVAAGVLAVGPGKQLEQKIVHPGSSAAPTAAEAASRTGASETARAIRQAGGSVTGDNPAGGRGPSRGALDRSRSNHRTEEQRRRAGGGDQSRGGDGRLGGGDSRGQGSSDGGNRGGDGGGDRSSRGPGPSSGSGDRSGSDHSGPGGGGDGTSGDSHTPFTGGGPLGGGGPGPSGDGGGDGSSGSGSSGSGTSGSGTSGSGSSGSGTSGHGSSDGGLSGSGSSARGSGDDLPDLPH